MDEAAWRGVQGREDIFDALVDFKPSEARGGKREKFEPRGETGIFAGYVLSTVCIGQTSIVLGHLLHLLVQS